MPSDERRGGPRRAGACHAGSESGSPPADRPCRVVSTSPVVWPSPATQPHPSGERGRCGRNGRARPRTVWPISDSIKPLVAGPIVTPSANGARHGDNSAPEGDRVEVRGSARARGSAGERGSSRRAHLPIQGGVHRLQREPSAREYPNDAKDHVHRRPLRRQDHPAHRTVQAGRRHHRGQVHRHPGAVHRPRQAKKGRLAARTRRRQRRRVYRSAFTQRNCASRLGAFSLGGSVAVFRHISAVPEETPVQRR